MSSQQHRDARRRLRQAEALHCMMNDGLSLANLNVQRFAMNVAELRESVAQMTDEELADRRRTLFGRTDEASLSDSQIVCDEIIRRRRASEEATEAQQVIAAVLRDHTRCSPRCTPELVAAEIDKALGGLRKITQTGVLVSGFLSPQYPGMTHEFSTETKTYTHWISGWTEAR